MKETECSRVIIKTILDAPFSSINTRCIRAVDYSTCLLVTITINSIYFTVKSLTISVLLFQKTKKLVKGLLYIVLKNYSHIFTLIDSLILIMMVQLIVFEQETRIICMSTRSSTQWGENSKRLK